MANNKEFPIRIPAIKVVQPIGVFYVASIEASTLLEVAYSNPAKIIEEKEKGYSFFGGQREKKEDRLKAIGRYIDTEESGFPNSVIIGANYHENGCLEENEEERWRVEETDIKDVCYLVIPTEKKLASIIDGQHRLFSFDKKYSERESMPLLCSIYLDLPLPYHAHIFATININQKSVDKSLAYELFGFNLDNEAPETWSPETFAVYLARVLNTDQDSPIKGNVLIGVQDSNHIMESKEWFVSLATIVDGILRLITSDPKRDRDIINKFSLTGGKLRTHLESNLRQPLRQLYIEGKDLSIYEIIVNYFSAAREIFWSHFDERSYIAKTVGIQALFDIMKIILSNTDPQEILLVTNKGWFRAILEKAGHIDFSDPFFQASGKGRGRIKNVIGICCNFVQLETLRTTEEEKKEYVNVLSKY